VPSFLQTAVRRLPKSSSADTHAFQKIVSSEILFAASHKCNMMAWNLPHASQDHFMLFLWLLASKATGYLVMTAANLD
jgi:hypothetical protein